MKNEQQLSCPIETTFDIIAGKWKGAICYHLKDDKKRFGELKKEINGVTQKMLTQQLRALVRDGIVSRKQYPVIPLKVEYELTELGRSLDQLFATVAGWYDTHLPTIEKSRKKYDKANLEKS